MVNHHDLALAFTFMLLGLGRWISCFRGEESVWNNVIALVVWPGSIVLFQIVPALVDSLIDGRSFGLYRYPHAPIYLFSTTFSSPYLLRVSWREPPNPRYTER